MAASGPGPASEFLLEWSAALCEASSLGPIVDLACGRGRHALFTASMGPPVIGLDRNPEHLKSLSDSARAEGLPIAVVRADLETGAEIPVRAGSCGAVLVFRYLHRPLARRIAALLAPGGLLLYETYLESQRDLGFGPTRDAFLLRPGELPVLFPELDVLEFNEGLREGPKTEATARLAAVKPR